MYSTHVFLHIFLHLRECSGVTSARKRGDLTHLKTFKVVLLSYQIWLDVSTLTENL